MDFFFFHWLLGGAFDYNQGEDAALTLWEQMEEDDRYANAMRFLLLFPVALY
jgi:hypothetical protein